MTICGDGTGEYHFVQGGYDETGAITVMREDQMFQVTNEGNGMLTGGEWSLEDDTLVLKIAASLSNGRVYRYTARLTACQAEETSVEENYPYQEDGAWHYGIRLNGEVLDLPHDALIYENDNPYNEILYPVTDILNLFGVRYHWNPEIFGEEFSTVVNEISVSRDPNDGYYMWFSNQQDGYGNSISPRNIDGVFYAPNYFFEHTIGAVLTKVAKGTETDLQYIDITTYSPYEWGNGALSEAIMKWQDNAYAITAPLSEYDDGFIQDWPAAGQIYRSTAYTCEDTELTINLENLKEDRAALAKIYTESGDLVSCLFFRGASAHTVQLPATTFRIRFATGQYWFGLYHLFGDMGQYEEMMFGDVPLTTLEAGYSYTLTINTDTISPDADSVGAQEVDRENF